MPIPASPGRAGLCLRNPSTVTDGAMRWAADLGGSPLGGVCEGNPGGGVPGARICAGISGLQGLAATTGPQEEA